jgi:addiction module RelB/DinJ family antitoxin
MANTAVINIKVNPELKAQAQNLAEELGFSLSSLVNACLKQIVRSRSVSFDASEIPAEYMINALKESKTDIKAGRVVSFKNGKEALKYLDKLIENDKKQKN